MACGVHSLQGKVAIITGSSSGIGAAMAIEFSKMGADVVLNGRKPQPLEEISKKCQAVSSQKRKPLILIGDVSDDAARVKIINDTVKHFGRLDILVNNAGFLLAKGLAADMDTSRLDAMYNIHVKAPFHLIKLAIPYLCKTKGNIINISSISALRTFGFGNLEYSMAKAALDHLTRFAALELGPKGIRCNSINPGATATSLLTTSGYSSDVTKKIYETMKAHHPIGRVGTPEDIAHLAAFLASDAACHITGIAIPIEGGSMLTSDVDFKGPE